MSRFVNLELNPEFEGHSEDRSVTKDAAHYLEEARLAFEEGEFERALRQYSKVLEFDPQSGAAWAGQVRALIEMGEFQEARLWADKALERFPNEAELLAAKGVALGRLGDLEAAMSFSDAAVGEHGDSAYVWLARADVLLARAERRADFCFDKALAMAPRNWVIHWLAARIRFYYQQMAQALKLAQPALEWSPGQSAVWLLAGLCQRELGLVGAARVSFTQATQLNPRCQEAAQALSTLGQIGVGARLRGWVRSLFKP